MELLNIIIGCKNKFLNATFFLDAMCQVLYYEIEHRMKHSNDALTQDSEVTDYEHSNQIY